MVVIFRTDASLMIGSGHVMRCLALAEILRKYGAEVEFVCRIYEGDLIDLIRKKEFLVKELQSSKNLRLDNISKQKK